MSWFEYVIISAAVVVFGALIYLFTMLGVIEDCRKLGALRSGGIVITCQVKP